MKNKTYINIDILLILGTTFVGLVTFSPSNQLVWASIAGSNNSSNSDQQEGATCDVDNCKEAIGHINEAQSAIKNGDTEGAQKHLDLAKKSIQDVCPGCMG